MINLDTECPMDPQDFEDMINDAKASGTYFGLCPRCNCLLSSRGYCVCTFGYDGYEEEEKEGEQ